MAVSDAQFEHCRSLLLAGRSGWSSSPPTTPGCATSGPTFVIDGRRRAARRRLALQRLGRPRRRALLPLGPRRPRRRARCSRSKAPTATGRRSCSRAARSTSTARGRCSRPRSACSTATATRSSRASRSRRALCDYLGAEQGDLARARRLRTTRPTATSTTSPASPGPASCCSPGPRTSPTPSTRSRATRCARLKPATDARGRSLEVVRVPSPGRSRSAPRRPRGVDAVAGHAAAPRRRPPRRLLRELLPRQLARRLPAARRAPRRRGGGDPRAAASPSARWSASRPARSCSAAATSTASPSRCRRPEPTMGGADGGLNLRRRWFCLYTA